MLSLLVKSECSIQVVSTFGKLWYNFYNYIMNNEGGNNSMGPFLLFLLIVLTVVIDYYLFDRDRKRWGWMKKSPTKNKALFFICFFAVSGLIYIGLSIKFL